MLFEVKFMSFGINLLKLIMFTYTITLIFKGCFMEKVYLNFKCKSIKKIVFCGICFVNLNYNKKGKTKKYYKCI